MAAEKYQITKELTEKKVRINNQSRLRLPEPGVFSGDHLKYPVWAKAFETLIESPAISSAEKPHYLEKYVSGEAKAIVEGFMLLVGNDTCERAKKQLSKRFGSYLFYDFITELDTNPFCLL
ncbi:Hypothetical predicted protein [Paramuricea clavata]|uniref:Uncharacterized protein n=1 Tax=Paramuricea clavata TaxID=317549 RepID=A0A7D9IGY2_PARCT|nr:Hypothetical predicted protein [Paramuricea clavata]